MKRPAKKKVNKGVIAAVGATVLGVAAGAAAMFLSKKENRVTVKNTVSKSVKKGKAQIAKVKKTVAAAKKKVVKK
jgi:hypothetical protein